MKNVFMLIILILTPWLAQAQGMFHLSFEHNQSTVNTAMDDSEISLPNKGSTVIVGGLNDLDGMGNYLNVYGSKLIVDSLDIASDGTQNIVFRREDGNNFFNRYPTMKAKLTPVNHIATDQNNP